ncbi:MAG TPA: beta-ketoacyl-ACP reductase [Saprospiraceae bacterium]|nr:beta-ketoacyl-ACP reductase [Saprospiraceae bacterium]HMP25934.1 beta-ketoacyl-ACP reductase [Saprospiraceae bacterium]
MGKLEGKVAIITGGANGIGKATALRFAAEGAKVAIWDINDEQGQATAALAKGKYYRVNTTDAAAVAVAAGQVIADFGSADILVNNAGITRDATLAKMTPEQWQQVIDVNLTGVFNCTKAISPYMVERGYGRILNASSVVGLYGNFGQTNYVATKAGVIGMTKVWARELGRKGITVNAVAPGFIATEMVAAMPEKVIKMMEDKTPLARLGQPEDIAAAYLFLASDEAAFINGATLSVDGGVSI